MNKDRIQGSAEQAKGKVKADQVAGKVQNTVGGLKDAVKEAVDD